MRKLYIIYFLTGLFFFTPLLIFGQISQGGKPLSFDAEKQSSLSEIKFQKMPFVDTKALKAEDKKIDPLRDRPWRFGKNIEVDFDTKNSGTWDVLKGGRKIWRLGIYSPGAVSLNLGFDNYYLPPGAELFIYTADKKEIIGAFTDFNNRNDKKFATTLLPGDKIIVEYNEPAHVEFSAKINLSRVTHGYRGVYEFSKGFGGSGDCNVNVACPEAEPREEQIRSVGMLVTGGSGFCSGALINNTRFDGKPYFLSADHCYSDPSTLVYWFNWQSETCEDPDESPSYNSISGATDVASNSESDFWLTELSSPPTEEFSPFYAGWNRTLASELNETVWGIHHPSGDIKKISWASGGADASAYLNDAGSGETHWRVGSWDDGTTTEGGSSGSPLFDSYGRIIGQLHGGYAACGNTDPDWYGRLGTSWTGGATPETSLQNWLDPEDSGLEAIDGYGPYDTVYTYDAQMYNIQVPEREYNEPQSVVPTVEIKNRGTHTMTSATVSYGLNEAAHETIEWQGSLEQKETATLQFSELFLSEGIHTFSVTVEIENEENHVNNTLNREIKVSDCGNAYTLPFAEDFEQGSTPDCWTYGGADWGFQNGGYNSNPDAAMEGAFNAYFFNSSFTAKISKLISPQLDLFGLSYATLEFWHAQQVWESDQDELRIYYKASTGGEWKLLEEYTEDVAQWTKRQIALPELSTDYYIAFEATAKWGYGVVLDEISITESPVSLKQLEYSGIEIYPNPARNYLKIQFPDIREIHSVQLYSVTGQCLYEHRGIFSETFEIDIQNLSPGIYFINIGTEGNVYKSKFVKQ